MISTFPIIEANKKFTSTVETGIAGVSLTIACYTGKPIHSVHHIPKISSALSGRHVVSTLFWNSILTQSSVVEHVWSEVFPFIIECMNNFYFLLKWLSAYTSLTHDVITSWGAFF